MSKLMYDSTTPSAIPADAPVVAYYDDGRYRWSTADRARFPNAIQVSIVCFPQSAGDILDVETGCSAPSDVPSWLDSYDRAMRRVPTLYVNRSNWDAVRAAVGSRQADYWVAIPGATSIPDGAVAVQSEYPGPYDVSLCRDEWPRMTPEEHQMLADLNARSAELYNFIRYGVDSAGNHEYDRDRLAELAAAVANLQIPAAQLKPVLDAIAVLKADLDGLTLKKA